MELYVCLEGRQEKSDTEKFLYNLYPIIVTMLLVPNLCQAVMLNHYISILFLLPNILSKCWYYYFNFTNEVIRPWSDKVHFKKSDLTMEFRLALYSQMLKLPT